MRNPNGYGSVYKLSGNRRRPFVAKVTNGWDDNGKQQYYVVGYYEKRRDALQALADYNENPYDQKVKKLTFSEVFDQWSRRKFEQVGQSSITSYNTAYKACSKFYDVPFVSIKTKHMQDLLLNCGKNYPSRKLIKILFHQLYKFAMQNDIVDKDYSQFLELGKKEETEKKKPFTDEEIEMLFNIADDEEIADSVLIMIFTGFRVGAMITIKTENVDTKNMIMVGGIKTEAGINRIMPIHNRIQPYILKRVAEGHEYLISRRNGEPYKNTTQYRDEFYKLMDKYGMKHKPHECRHTFATLMHKANANKVALMKLIGHTQYQTTLGYTHTDIEELQSAIELI